MAKTKEQVIEQIKKCLKLNQGTNFQGEAEHAMAAAMRLAAGIGMTVDEIKLDSGAGSQSGAIGKNNVGAIRSKIPQWEVNLASGIAEALGCQMVIHCGWNEQLKKRCETFILIGTEQDATLFNWLYPYIIQQLRRLCHRDWTTTNIPAAVMEINPGYRKAWERSWYRGAALRVIEKAEEKFKEDTTKQEQEQYALVVCNKKEQCRQFMDSQMHVTQTTRRQQKGIGSAMSYGYNSAGEVTMNRPIESTNTKEIR